MSRCKHLTANGKPCKAGSNHPSGFCRMHRKKYAGLGKVQALVLIDLRDKGLCFTKYDFELMASYRIKNKSDCMNLSSKIKRMFESFLKRGYFNPSGNYFCFTEIGENAVHYCRVRSCRNAIKG